MRSYAATGKEAGQSGQFVIGRKMPRAINSESEPEEIEEAETRFEEQEREPYFSTLLDETCLVDQRRTQIGRASCRERV